MADVHQEQIEAALREAQEQGLTTHEIAEVVVEVVKVLVEDVRRQRNNEIADAIKAMDAFGRYTLSGTNFTRVMGLLMEDAEDVARHYDPNGRNDGQQRYAEARHRARED